MTLGAELSPALLALVTLTLAFPALPLGLGPEPLLFLAGLLALPLSLGQAALVVSLDLPEAVVLGPGLPEEHRRRQAEPHEEQETQANNEASQIHDMGQTMRRASQPGSKGDFKLAAIKVLRRFWRAFSRMHR